MAQVDVTVNLENEIIKRFMAALDIAERYGTTDGDHHKMWVIDQMVRALAGEGYADWVTAVQNGEDGPETYLWDEGIAP